jgi:hypothetical protein
MESNQSVRHFAQFVDGAESLGVGQTQVGHGLVLHGFEIQRAKRGLCRHRST